MKKIIAIALALVMCLGIMSMVAFAAGDKMTVKVTAPAEWTECYVYSWEPEAFGSWPGTKIDGSFELTETVKGMVISEGNGKPQTVDITDLVFAAGTEATIVVGEKGDDGKHTYTITAGGSNNGGETDSTTTAPTTAAPTTTAPTTAQTVTSGNRTLTIKAPSSWSNVHVYTWEPEDFGTWPGSKLTKSGDVYKVNVKNSMVNLVIATEQADTTYKKTDDIKLETNGKAVTITINEDCSYKVEYDGVSSSSNGGTRKPAAADPQGTASSYRVVGNAEWMGSWKEDNDLGVMIEIEPGVYRKNFDNVEPGSYELKITKDGKWDNAYGDENGQNFKFTVDQKCKITVDFTLKDGKGVISVYGSGVPATGDISLISVMILLGLASVTAIVLVVNKKKFI